MSVWTQVPVRGTYRTFYGTPVQGWVRFTMPYRMADNVDRTIYPADGELTVQLDQAGHFETLLPATDDPSVSPTGWVYRVQERFDVVDGRAFPLSVPMARAGTGIDLVTALPTDVFPPESSVLYRGVPGGVAVLDQYGQVVDAQGNVVAGGGGSSAFPPVVFSAAQATWSTGHTLGRLPVVTCFIDGVPVDAPTTVSTTSVAVTWPYPVAGVMVLT